jgi:hypothetical protein
MLNYNSSKETNYTLLSQQVDTLKLHLYPSIDITQKSIVKYRELLQTLKELKSQAQTLKAKNQDERFVVHHFDSDTKFHVMSSTVSGFAVTIKNADVSISIKDFKKLPVVNPTIKVEFRAHYLTRMGYLEAINQVQKVIDNYIIDKYSIKVSEIHLCADIQGYNFNILDLYRIKTRARTKVAIKDETEDNNQTAVYLTSNQFNSFRYGSSNYMLRIYNKTLEIKKHPEKSYIKRLKWEDNPHYKETAPVWRIEFQVRRTKLKDMYIENIGQLDGFERVLNNIDSIWSRCMEDFNLKDLSDSSVHDILRGYTINKKGNYKLMTKYAERKRFQRADSVELWKDITYFNGFIPKEIKKLPKIDQVPDRRYIYNSIKGVFTQFFKQYSSEATPDNLQKIFTDCNDEILQKHEMDIIDYANIKALDYMDKSKGVLSFMGMPTDNISLMKMDLEETISSIIASTFETEPTNNAIKEYQKRVPIENISRC